MLLLSVSQSQQQICYVFFVKGLKNRRCAMCRAEFPNEFLERPQLLLPINTSPSTSNTDQNEYQWFYKGHNGLYSKNPKSLFIANVFAGI